MAKIVLEICDYCKKPAIPIAKLTVKVKGEPPIVADICKDCHISIGTKVAEPYQPRPVAPIPDKVKQLEDGIHIVPASKVLPVGQNKVPAGCQHSGRQSFEPPSTIKCGDCGATWQTD